MTEVSDALHDEVVDFLSAHPPSALLARLRIEE
jgi:hypothetical protein